MNIANTNACRKTYLGNQTPISVSNLIFMPKSLCDSSSNSIYFSLITSTYAQLWEPIRELVRTTITINNIRL